MASLGENRWGKSEIRVSKVRPGDNGDDFFDLAVQVLLTGDVAAAYLEGDNAAVLPTDTSKNTVYGLAQDHLTDDLEDFGALLCDHFVTKEGIDSAEVLIKENRWSRHSPTGFIGGGSETRTARVSKSVTDGLSISAGVEGLVVLKTRGSAFVGFPKDEFTTLPEAEDRLLATSVTAEWLYEELPADTTAAWETVRSVLIERFFADWSASVQHQGWQMAEAALDAVPEISEMSFRLPNQHHLAFDMTSFGLENNRTVFHPVSEPYGDIRFTAHR